MEVSAKRYNSSDWSFETSYKKSNKCVSLKRYVNASHINIQVWSMVLVREVLKSGLWCLSEDDNFHLWETRSLKQEEIVQAM